MENEKLISKNSGLSTSSIIGIIVTIVVVFTLGIISIVYQEPKTLTSNPSYSPSPSPNTDVSIPNTPPLDVSALTPQIINKIVQKIRSTPNASCGGYPCIKTTFDSGVGVVTLIYEFSADPLTPGSKESLLVEISTKTYLDEEGKPYLDEKGNEIPKNNILPDVFQFRDTDFDATPNDYWSTSFGQNMNFEIINRNTPDLNYLMTIWAFGIDYFDKNLLKN